MVERRSNMHEQGKSQSMRQQDAFAERSRS
jgi:hypothetical protein